MDIAGGLIQGFAVALQPANLLWCFVGVLLGTVVGIMPGLGPPATIAMLLPLTALMNPAGAMIMLAGIYYGAKYGGSTTSILLNVPGESASVVTCLDGYAMARKAAPDLRLASRPLPPSSPGPSVCSASCWWHRRSRASRSPSARPNTSR